jgi:hypothetical protein
MVVNPESFERVKTDVSDFVHGKELDYQITTDPGLYVSWQVTRSAEYSHTL